MTTTPQANGLKILRWFGWGLTTIGTILILVYLYLLYVSWSSSEWVKTPGVVKGHSIEWRISSIERKKFDPAREYYYEVIYEYEVNETMINGRRYAVGQVSPGKIHGSQEKAREEAQKDFPLGREVTVYYNPADPYDAVLKAGIHSVTHIPLYLGVFVLASGLLFLLIKPKDNGKKQTG